MRILDRYLIKGFLLPFFYCTFLFIILFITIDCFNNLDEFINKDLSIWIPISYYFYMIPFLLVQVIPAASLVSVIYFLGNLNKHNELTALKASGVSSSTVLSPFLFFGVLISFFMLLLNETIVPKTAVTSTAIMESVIDKGRNPLGERAINNVTVYGTHNRMIFARELEIKKDILHDVVILEHHPDQTLKSKLTAKRAAYKEGDWIFYNVVRYQLNRRGDINGTPDFRDVLALELDEKPQDFISGTSQTKLMNAKQLGEHIEKLEHSSKKMVHRLWVDFHNKIAFPFISLIILVIGVSLSMRTRRGGALLGIGTSLVVMLSYYAIDSVCLAVGKAGYLPALVSAWLPNLIFAVIGIYFIRKTA